MSSPRVHLLQLFGVSLSVILSISETVSQAVQAQNSNINPHALQLKGFQEGVSEYIKLHKSAAAQLGALKPTESPGEIGEYQRQLADKIRAARPLAKQGDLFAPPVAREFRTIIRHAMQSSDGARIRTSLRRSDPAKIKLAVNSSYPATVPAETSPASLLLNLPELPQELAYRVVGQDLLLLDVTANLIVDYVPNALP
jgi:hypothetical protein